MAQLLHPSQRGPGGPLAYFAPMNDTPPPPPPPTPILRPARTREEVEELFNRRFDANELNLLRTHFPGSSVLARYKVEEASHRQLLNVAFTELDHNGVRTYCGPDLLGRAGKEREKVMIRHNIKSRWERGGFWDPSWGIPGRVEPQPERNDNLATWKWANPESPRLTGGAHPQSLALKELGWPAPEVETTDERAIRHHLQWKGLWPWPAPVGCQVHEEETRSLIVDSAITGRPWYVWNLEVLEESIRLARLHGTFWTRYDQAAANVIARWKVEGRWKPGWLQYDEINHQLLERPGWSWPMEPGSPQTTHPNHLRFSLHEIDALNSIQPPSPPPGLGPIARLPRPPTNGNLAGVLEVKTPVVNMPMQAAAAEPDGGPRPHPRQRRLPNARFPRRFHHK